MTKLSRTPTFNLKVVLNETGLKPDTIRAWERRYKLLQPDRSEGGHRLYSEYDIHLLEWLIARQAEGLSIGRAAALWRRLIEQGQDPLEQLDKAPLEAQRESYDPVQGSAISQQRDAWVEACIAFDEQRAERVLAEAFASYPAETVCIEVLIRGLAQIGDEWHQGRVTVPQEHFASALASRRLQALIGGSPSPTREGRILVACPSAEDHVFSALVVTCLLRRSGWDVVYLGANVPADGIESAIEAVRPRLAILSAQRLSSAASLAEMAEIVAGQGVPVAYGGRIFNLIPALSRHIQGHFLAGQIEDVPAAVEKLLEHGFPDVRVEPPSAGYPHALSEFNARRGAIEMDMQSYAAASNMNPAYFMNANIYLSQDIAAALMLGDITYADADVAWIEQVLIHRDIPTGSLKSYLRIYWQVAGKYLEADHPVMVWLGSYSKES